MLGLVGLELGLGLGLGVGWLIGRVLRIFAHRNQLDGRSPDRVTSTLSF